MASSCLKLNRLALRIGVVLALVGLIIPNLVWACGGFFSPPGSAVFQNALRVVFAVDKTAGTITEEVGMQYSGSAKDFTWLMPLPAVPTVDVGSSDDLDTLDHATAEQFTVPHENYCPAISTLAENPEGRGGGGGGGPPSFVEGQVGPYDYAIIQNARPDEMLSWLHDKGYTVPPDAQATIAAYIREGDVFLAMRLKPDTAQDAQNATESAQSSGVPIINTIAPVVLTYKSNKVVLPARMGGVTKAAGSILVWIFGDSQYAPVNYTHPALEPELSNGLSSVRYKFPETAHIGNFEPFRDTDPQPFEVNQKAYDVYDTVVQKLSNRYHGQMFVTDYAGPSEQLAASADFPSGTIGSFLADYKYVTRLAALMSTDQMTLDPIFAPAPNLPDVSNMHALPVDPLDYYGCDSLASVSQQVVTEFATSHKRFDDAQFTVAYPPGWVLSQFTVKGFDPSAITLNDLNGTAGKTYTVNVYSPKTVQLSDITNYLAGRPAPPMLLFSGFTFPDLNSWQTALYPDTMVLYPANDFTSVTADGADGMLRSIFGYSRQYSANLYVAPKLFSNSQLIVDPQQGSKPITGVVLDLLIAPKEQKAHQQLYDDVIAYASAHLYYADPNALDSLFLSRIDAHHSPLNDTYVMPIPDGWTAAVDPSDQIVPADQVTSLDQVVQPNNAVVIRLNNAQQPDLAPTMRLIPINPSFLGSTVDGVTPLIKRFALPDSSQDAIVAAVQGCPADPSQLQPVAFTTGGLVGQVLFSPDYVVSISATADDWPKYKATLTTMLTSYRNGLHACS